MFSWSSAPIRCVVFVHPGFSAAPLFSALEFLTDRFACRANLHSASGVQTDDRPAGQTGYCDRAAEPVASLAGVTRTGWVGSLLADLRLGGYWFARRADCSAGDCPLAARCAAQLQADWEQAARWAEPQEADSILEVYSPRADCSAGDCPRAARCAAQLQADWEQVARWAEPQEADSILEVYSPRADCSAGDCPRAARCAAQLQADWEQVVRWA